LGNALESSPCEVGTNELRVRSAENKYSYPDLVGFCSAPQLAPGSVDILLNPELIVEILSPDTESFDRGTKFALYRRILSFKEYILILQTEAYIEQYTLQPDGTWSLRFISGLDAILHFTSMSCSVALRDIYRNVNFGTLNSKSPRPDGPAD
jgi:Uma2 family endonuclease